MEIFKKTKFWVITSICLVLMFIGLAVMSAGNYIELQKLKANAVETSTVKESLKEETVEAPSQGESQTSENSTASDIQDTSEKEESKIPVEETTSESEEEPPNQGIYDPTLPDTSGDLSYNTNTPYTKTAIDWVNAYYTKGTVQERMDALRPYMEEDLLNRMFSLELKLLDRYGSNTDGDDGDSDSKTTDKIEIQYTASKSQYDSVAQVFVIYHDTRKWVSTGKVDDIFKLMIFDLKRDAKTDKWIINDIHIAHDVQTRAFVRGG